MVAKCWFFRNVSSSVTCIFLVVVSLLLEREIVPSLWQSYASRSSALMECRMVERCSCAFFLQTRLFAVIGAHQEQKTGIVTPPRGMTALDIQNQRHKGLCSGKIDETFFFFLGRVFSFL